MSAPLICPACSSQLVQPLGWKVCSENEVAIDLRCPECFTWTHGCFTPDQMRAMDLACRQGRAALVRSYERCVAESMEALADLLARAMALDLVGADDFLPRSVTLAR